MHMFIYVSNIFGDFIQIFSFCSSHWLISNYLSLSSLVLLHDQGFLLKFSIEFFSSVLVFFSCSISACLFFMVSTSLLKFMHCSCIAFLILFSCLPVFSCLSLSFFKRFFEFFFRQIIDLHFFELLEFYKFPLVMSCLT